MKRKSIKFSTLLLDFDGVILESAEIKTQAFIEMFSEHREHLDAIVHYHQQHSGTSRYTKFAWIYKELLKKPLSDATLRKLGARFTDIVFDKIVRTPFVPGALETLKTCVSLEVPIFVISATPLEELNQILELRDLNRYVTKAWGSPTEKTTAIQQIRKSYGFRPNDMLFVGDGFNDYQSARSEGVPFVARDLGEQMFDWAGLEVPSIPDLTCFAAIAPNSPITIPTNSQRVPEMTITLV